MCYEWWKSFYCKQRPKTVRRASTSLEMDSVNWDLCIVEGTGHQTAVVL